MIQGHSFLSFGIALAIARFISATPVLNDTIVNTPSGKLQGSILQTWTDKNFYSFRGVPFAEPPIGNLRFKVSEVYLNDLKVYELISK